MTEPAEPGTRDAALVTRLREIEGKISSMEDLLNGWVAEASEQGADAHADLYDNVRYELQNARESMRLAAEMLGEGHE